MVVGQKIKAPFFRFQSNEKAGRAVPNVYGIMCVSNEEEPPCANETSAVRPGSDNPNAR